MTMNAVINRQKCWIKLNLRRPTDMNVTSTNVIPNQKHTAVPKCLAHPCYGIMDLRKMKYPVDWKIDEFRSQTGGSAGGPPSKDLGDESSIIYWNGARPAFVIYLLIDPENYCESVNRTKKETLLAASHRTRLATRAACAEVCLHSKDFERRKLPFVILLCGRELQEPAQKLSDKWRG